MDIETKEKYKQKWKTYSQRPGWLEKEMKICQRNDEIERELNYNKFSTPDMFNHQIERRKILCDELNKNRDYLMKEWGTWWPWKLKQGEIK